MLHKSTLRLQSLCTLKCFPALVLILLFTNSTFASEDEGDSVYIKRGVWFYSQRSSPGDTIPLDAYRIAVEEASSMQPGGYYLQTAWRNIGPAPYYFQSSYVSGRVTAITFAPNNRLFIGAAQGGVWEAQSLNPLTWVKRVTGLTSLSSGCITIASDGTLYYGTGENYMGKIYVYAGNGIYKSTDEGLSWANYRVNSTGRGEPVIFRIAVKPVTTSHLFAATSIGLFKSVNGGVNWSIVSGTENEVCTDVAISAEDENNIFAVGPAGGTGYIISTDGGANFFTPSHNYLTIEGRTVLSVCTGNDSYVYIATDKADDSGCKVYLSTDGGFHFQYKETISESTQQGHNLCLAVKPDDPSVLFVGTIKLYKSINYGTSFTDAVLFGNPYHYDYHGISFNPANTSTVTVATDGGVFMTSNSGDNWVSLNNADLQLVQAYRIGLSPTTIYGGFQDNGMGKDGIFSTDLNWIYQATGGDGTGIAISPKTDIVMNVNLGTIYRFVNGSYNNSWNNTQLETYWDERGYDWIGAITAHPQNYGEFYTARRNANNPNEILFKKCTNGGTAWSNLSNVSSPVPPQNIEFSKTNPSIVYLGTSGRYGPEPNPLFGREVYKSINGGVSWGQSPIIDKNDLSIVPNLYITRIVTAPAVNPNDEDEVYITLSGFLQGNTGGHVYKSTDGGSNWQNISGNLPYIPANDIAVCQVDCNTKILAVATDIGVYASSNGGQVWKELAEGLAYTLTTDLEYMPVENKLKAATFGRSVFEADLNTDTYITGEVVYPNYSYVNKNIIICPGGKLKFTDPVTVHFAQGKKIIVQDGGEIDISTGVSVTFTSQSGNWGGIEFQGEGHGIIKSCMFRNVNTPISITGNILGSLNPPAIVIDACDFQNGAIEVTNRAGVTIKNCYWQMYLSEYADAITAIGAEGMLVQNNTVNYITSVPGSHAIQLSQCNNSTVTQSTITGADFPVTVSNGTYYIRYSDIISGSSASPVDGIYLNGVNSGHLWYNDVSGYQVGYRLENSSSPTVYSNTTTGSNGDGDKTAFYCYNGSSPRLRPSVDESNQLVWDAGMNYLRNDGTGSRGIYVENNCDVDIDYGFNTIFGITYNLLGTDYPASKWFATCNGWVNPPIPAKFNVPDVDIIYEPYDCEPPGGGAKRGGKNNPVIIIDEPEEIPPQPIIVNYDNGIIDTLNVSAFNGSVSPDKALYGSAEKEVYTGNFEDAVNKFKSVIQNYQDSADAIHSLNRIFYCYGRMNADSIAYSNLKIYYVNLASVNSGDLLFAKTAMELSRKCLIRKKEFENAITEYEGVIQNSQDSSDIIPAEISVIELYVLLSSQGDAPAFTGQLGYLKPSGLKDAMSRIREKMKHLGKITTTANIPKEFSLSQNYPNPFNPLTKINYAVPNGTTVTLKVYDILGRLVKTLVNEFKDAGNYTVTFDGSGLASGIYFYKIEAGDFVQSKKMILVK